ncbi:hypothetical protein B0G71_0067 [Paraburkholderia sp. BL27I4N3]|jgi:hypothetical protein|uniref:BPSL0761 family protein n=1 Tax=Paraburkholderia sp. BL27I4N3 TaxID=1938805 RepID=UPI000E286EE3|nr:BPSL0761 family protein [Paraburkholderia sp. BL27I4N3]REE17129.1 hypothetical protein B0G71_0067 [Paraburkholderia sp. BL27I4N3]
MTMPHERTRSVLRTRELLQMLASGSDVPDMDELRDRALSLLRHFPDKMHFAWSAQVLPAVWGNPDEKW